jgi:hypothetical protein
MERTLERDGETRPIYEVLWSLAAALELADFLPWGSVEGVHSILDHPTTSHATVASPIVRIRADFRVFRFLALR